MFAPIAPERFEQFHREFHSNVWDVCERCGGQCEISRIGSLLPGEAEFIAAHVGCDIKRFRSRYLDGVKTPGGVVDVLKMRPSCPMLGNDCRCGLDGVKPVLCEIYPLAFEIQNHAVVFTLDPWCPMVRFESEIAEDFERIGIPALNQLGVEGKWFQAAGLFDSLCVDYQKISALRSPKQGYTVYPVDFIQECRDEIVRLPNLASSHLLSRQAI